MELLGECEVCGKVRPGRECRECWGCKHVCHVACTSEDIMAEGPYYCRKCRELARETGVRDVTLD